MKRTIEIEDTLQDRVDNAIDEVSQELVKYFEDNDPDRLPDLSDLDFHDAIHEIVDGCVPIYTSEIKDTWYLHKNELIESYENSGIGRDSLENDGMTAIYCYIMDKVNEWYHDKASILFNELLEQRRKLLGR